MMNKKNLFRTLALTLTLAVVLPLAACDTGGVNFEDPLDKGEIGRAHV